MDLSVVIASWNTRVLLRDCLASLYAETGEIPFEVIVVDNGSCDGTLEMLREEFPEVLLIANRCNLGYSRANNQGIERSRGRHVCLLNSDTVVLDAALTRMVRFLDRRSAAGAVSCLLVNPDGSHQFASALGETNLLYMLSIETGLYRKFPGSRLWGRPFLSFLDLTQTQEVEVCPSAAMVVRRTVFDTVGLLDENIFFGTIDWDFSFRARQGGWKLYLFPEARVIHYGGRSKDPIREDLLRKDYRSQYYYFRKTYGRLSMNIFRALIIVSSALKLALLAMRLRRSRDPKEAVRIRHKMANHSARLRVSVSGPALGERRPEGRRA